jgi:hypothetical protein
LIVLGPVRAENKYPAGGRPVAGLQLSLQAVEAKNGEKTPSHVRVVVENVDTKDLNVWLGFSLNNLRAHYPERLSLIARAPGEKAREFHYTNHQGGIAGRMDAFVVPLPAGASYSLRCAVDDFVDADFKPIDFTSKDLSLAVELDSNGNAERADDRGKPAEALIPCWEGKVRSNEIKFVKSRKP